MLLLWRASGHTVLPSAILAEGERWVDLMLLDLDARALAAKK